MTFLWHTKEWLSIPQLVQGWSLELAKVGKDPNQYQRELQHLLLEDIINGRLDDTGPLREKNGRRLGLRLELQGSPIFIEGNEIRALVCCPEPISLHRILVMKEAVLDFAKRREIPPPPWWTDGTDVPTDVGVITKDTHSVAASPTPAPTPLARPRGRKPKKLDQAKQAMREEIRLGPLTPVALRDMPEKNLADRYGVSRDTARKARDAVLSEMLPAAAPDRT